ncbi:uncharacterized protein BX664DRAFT_324829 [Halteromyces radiatus]|uniref:uncharacterized protein n=1 Tax=Halteromyces radiatus TaxID=101107 RepID=UPI00221F91CB|nr:uncharacterized protein BX664DRAFT_324829 [Halteromyces radiatus]KAI8096787.1 hypothetical protein BX664DRAFT_324829 [Halteromyces radiatus]
MKFSVAAFVVSAIATVAAQVPNPTGIFNVTSPTPNSPYVAQQILPCTYRIFQDVDTTGITLNIQLSSTAAGSNTTLVIATNADVSKSSNSANQNGNITYYEHSVNYNIPTTVTPGSYKVSFIANGAPLDIPISILPAASSTALSKSGSASGSSPTSSGGSIFTGDASRMNFDLTTKTMMALTAVAGIAFVL